MFSGVYTALVTPFLKNKNIDYISLQKLLKEQEESLVDGVVLLGTTAEECTLTLAECKSIIRLAKQLLTKKIIIGVSGNCTKTVLDKIKEYEEFNADAYLIGTPYYNKPTSNGLVNHFTKIANSTTKPIILYNIPSRCGVKLDFNAISKLSKCKNIVAIKEASGDIDYFTKLITLYGQRFNILCGNDNIFLPMLACGAIGCISVASNVYPNLVANLYKNYNINVQKCIFLHNKLNLFANILFAETNPMCVKYILSKYNLCKNVLREPLCTVKKSTKQKINSTIKQLNIDCL